MLVPHQLLDGAWRCFVTKKVVNLMSGFSQKPTTIVRRHINWNNPRADLKEDLAHLVQDIKGRKADVRAVHGCAESRANQLVIRFLLAPKSELP